MSNILVDKLPTSVDINGISYSIDTDFRTSIKFELLIQESEETQENRLIKALKFYYGDTVPKDIDKAIDKILWFFSCGKLQENTKNNIKLGGNRTRAYSFNYDKNYIYSAFYQQYGIDLVMSNLHWWQFKALFDGLTDDTLFAKIMYYRTVNISSKMSKSEQVRLRKLKEIYALPPTKAEQKQLDEIENALIMGDLSSIDF